MYVVNAADGTSPEVHFVFCQRARFVGEDVLNLSQVLGDVHGFHLHGPITLRIIQLDVASDEEYLTHLDQFNGHIQRQWNHCLVGEEKH